MITLLDMGILEKKDQVQNHFCAPNICIFVQNLLLIDLTQPTPYVVYVSVFRIRYFSSDPDPDRFKKYGSGSGG